MRLRLILAAAIAALMLVIGAGAAQARCYTPCIPGQNCLQVCQDIPDLW